MLTDKTIGLLGAGAMAGAIIGGLLDAGLVAGSQVLVTNRADRERLGQLQRCFGVRVTPEPEQVAEVADVLVVAVKPKDVDALLRRVGPFTRPGQVLLTLAAGVSTATFAARVRPGVQVVRAMPNTSSLVRESATAMCLGAGAGPGAAETARAILGAVGTVVEVPEPLLDAVTGLSGSGPAYVYLMIESMVQAGTRAGLPPQVASALAVQTLVGAAKMLQQPGADPAVLRQQVTSPGGTTQAGLGVLAERGFSEAVCQAIARATERSRELGAALRPVAPPGEAAV